MERKIKLFIIINILIIALSFFFINYLGKTLNDRIIHYSEIEAEKIAKYIVNYAVKEEVITKLNNNFISISKDKNGDTSMIEFNSAIVNQLLIDVTNSVLELFKDIENGKTNILDLSNNLLTNTKINDYKEGIIIEVPVGLATNNFILSNLGPKIPVRLSITGEIESFVTTSVVEYGINNALVTTFIHIAVSEEILMPLGGKKITITSQIPISINMIAGKVPSYYLGGRTNSSALYNLPVF